MTDNIKPDHYRKGEIDLYEAFSQIFPHNEYRAGMQMIAMRYMFRDKVDRVEDLGKAVETLERLKEKESEHAKRNSKTLQEAFNHMANDLGCVKTKIAGTYLDDVYRYHDDLLKRLRSEGYRYLARDEDDVLFAYEGAPVKVRGFGFWDAYILFNHEYIGDDDFPEVQWTDEKPTKISYLLEKYQNGRERGN